MQDEAKAAPLHQHFSANYLTEDKVLGPALPLAPVGARRTEGGGPDVASSGSSPPLITSPHKNGSLKKPKTSGSAGIVTKRPSMALIPVSMEPLPMKELTQATRWQQTTRHEIANGPNENTQPYG